MLCCARKLSLMDRTGPRKHPRDWTVGDACIWLQIAKLECLCATFRRHEVSGTVLLRFRGPEVKALVAAHCADAATEQAGADALTKQLNIAVAELQRAAGHLDGTGSDDEECTAGTKSAAPLSAGSRLRHNALACVQYLLMYITYCALRRIWSQWGWGSR